MLRPKVYKVQLNELNYEQCIDWCEANLNGHWLAWSDNAILEGYLTKEMITFIYMIDEQDYLLATLRWA